MDTKTRDFLVGLLVLAAVGVVLATIVRTGRLQSGDRFPLYMRTEVAQNLTRDTRVFLKGLEVGRLRQVNPVADTVTGSLTFVALLEVDERFPDGTQLTLPVGTEAMVAQPTPIAAPEVQLIVPSEPSVSRLLAPGDTIESTRQVSTLDLLGEVASQMKDELLATFQEVRALIRTSNQVAVDAQAQLNETTPRINALLAQVSDMIDHTESILTDTQPRLAMIQDSVLAALSDTRQLIQKMDSLAVMAHAMAGENGTINDIIGHMQRTAEILSHFADQASRRPLRILSGITPPDDTATSH